MRCAEGIGDAESLPAAQRSAWRAKALKWERFDLEGFRSRNAAERQQMCQDMRSHLLLLLS